MRTGGNEKWMIRHSWAIQRGLTSLSLGRALLSRAHARLAQPGWMGAAPFPWSRPHTGGVGWWSPLIQGGLCADWYTQETMTEEKENRKNQVKLETFTDLTLFVPLVVTGVADSCHLHLPYTHLCQITSHFPMGNFLLCSPLG